MQTQTDSVGGVGGELLSDAKDVGTKAVNRLHSEVDTRKGDAVTQVKSVSSAIEKTAGGLDDSAPTWLKSALEQGAQQVQKFADTLEQKDSRQLVKDVGDFARNSPGTFLAACAAAGFAAARIFKAGSSENQPVQPGPVGFKSDPVGGYQSDSFGSSPAPAKTPRGEFA